MVKGICRRSPEPSERHLRFGGWLVRSKTKCLVEAKTALAETSFVRAGFAPWCRQRSRQKGDDHGLDNVQGDGHFEKGARRQRRDLGTRDHGVIRLRNS